MRVCSFGNFLSFSVYQRLLVHRLRQLHLTIHEPLLLLFLPNLPPCHDHAQPVSYRRKVFAEEANWLAPIPQRVADIVGQSRDIDRRGAFPSFYVEEEGTMGLLRGEGVLGELEVFDIVLGS